MGAFFRRLIREEDGSDIVEYALVAALVGISGFAALAAMQVGLRTAYLSWGTATNDLWLMPDPSSGGS